MKENYRRVTYVITRYLPPLKDKLKDNSTSRNVTRIGNITMSICNALTHVKMIIERATYTGIIK